MGSEEAASRIAELESQLEEARKVIEEIADKDWIENCLDSQWAKQTARAYLDSLK